MMGLMVEVSIFTSQLFPQGTTRVKEDGSWKLTGHFGASAHTIKAVLKQKGGEEITSTTKEVMLIR